MKKLLPIATFFIAAFAVSTEALAQKTIYRCGATYSQIPCAGGVTLEANDTRSKTDKNEADNATKRDMKQAREMEKTRLKDEKDALAVGKLAAKSDEKLQDKPVKEPHEAKKPKPKHKKKEPEFFTAKAAPEKKKD
jgi:hypothetical protein